MSLVNSVCHRKRQMTEEAARAHAEANGNDPYPCPYSIGERHWHVGTGSSRQASPRWFGNVHREALELGAMGWPEGYAIAILRARWAERKAARQSP